MKGKTKKKEYIIAITFLAPALILLFCFIIYPVMDAAFLSLHSWKGMYGQPKKWVGLDNFIKALTSGKFWNAMLNCVWFMLGSFVVLMPIAFGLAMLITSKLKFTRIMKTAYFMPVMLGTTAVALMWTNILNPGWGALAQFLRFLGLDGLVTDWLSKPVLNVICVVLVNEWMFAGYNMLIFAAGLVSIPHSLYEAAFIDGCGGWQRVRYITLPLMKNTFKIFSILAFTGSLKVFDIVWAMTRGGPGDVSSTPGIILYTEAFQYKLFGRSSAYSIILLVFGIVISLVVNRIFRQDEEMY
ncbi:carbohydrate ABC transporter permease [Murimonas intestini]|uniref:carbohydrate ABC transporter permease n=1 Tax=Murimonas intestini TaxID=1337051 RepID=UPI0011DE504D|nr:sugar ABC transporter permease [Murimonas intestini]